jgi:3-deoxy-D-manno-octulosonic-acid transferase
LLRTFITKKEKKGYLQRIGFIENCFPENCILIHAVSVGEVVLANEIIKKLKVLIPEVKIVISTITDAGNTLAKKNPEIEKAVYLPLDFPHLISNFLNKINPKILVIMETELWPNFLKISKKRGIKIVLLNGRISDKSFKIYKRFRFFFKEVLKNIDFFYVRSEEDKKRILYLGAREEKIVISGNIKFDIEAPKLKKEELKKLKERLKIKEESLIWVAGSTHYNEEEKIILVYIELLKKFENLVLILAPRHIERTEEIKNLIKKYNIKFSLLTEPEENSSIILVNTIGELFLLYNLADVVFVGGSLVEKGGHNILEPMSLGKPTLFGPHMENFREIVEIVERKNAGIKVKDEKELEEKLGELFTDREKFKKIKVSLESIFLENQGASQKSAELLKNLWEN